MLFGKSKISPIEAAELIERFVDGGGEPHEWGDFICIRCRDPIVENARIQCVATEVDHPVSSTVKAGVWYSEEGIRVLKKSRSTGGWCSEEGMRVLRKIAEQLRASVE
jgi:hypothetical protein